MIPQLVVCAGQLLLTAWDSHQSMIRIWEVDAEGKKYKFVADSRVEEAALLVPVPVHMNIGGIRLSPRGYYNGSAGTNVVVLGTDDDRIVFSSSITHRRLAFVVADRSWVRTLTRDRLIPLRSDL